MAFKVVPLPFENEKEFETIETLKKAASAHRYLAELKGLVESIPNEAILINALTLQEAKDSSEIENIITTHDDLYKSELFSDSISPATKEVQNYAVALKHGFALVKKNKILRVNDIVEIQQKLERNEAGFRKLPGTVLRNQATNEIVYEPPQQGDDVDALMANFADYINDPYLSECDQLIKMAIIHFQFESIHPFYDGNGRTGRILNILYLVMQNLINIPILYLSRFITQNKGEYYKRLQNIRDKSEWHEWIMFVLEGVEQTSRQTIYMVKNIKQQMIHYKNVIKKYLPKIYSHELLNNLFKHPYTKIEFLMNDVGVSRITATKYLDSLVSINLLEKEKVGRSNYYINRSLCNLFVHGTDL